jgi:hypothetical protein
MIADELNSPVSRTMSKTPQSQAKYLKSSTAMLPIVRAAVLPRLGALGNCCVRQSRICTKSSQGLRIASYKSLLPCGRGVGLKSTIASFLFRSLRARRGGFTESPF